MKQYPLRSGATGDWAAKLTELKAEVAIVLKMVERLEGWAESKLLAARLEPDLSKENLLMNEYRSYADVAAQLKKAVR